MSKRHLGRIAPIRDIDRIKATIPVAPPIRFGELPRKSPELWRFRNPRYRGQLIGCCVGESGAAMAETTIRTPEPLSPESQPRAAYDLSPLWVYYIARRKSVELGARDILNGEGAVVTHALEAVIEHGFVPFEDWPATKETYEAYRDNPPARAERATKHKPIKDMRRLEDPDQVLEYLAGGYSVWIGVPWTATNPDGNGRFRWGGRSVGGHAVELLGYDLDKDEVCVGNSWDNAKWGVQPGGYGFTSWKALARTLSAQAISRGVSEAVVVTEIEGQWVSKVPSWAEVL